MWVEANNISVPLPPFPDNHLSAGVVALLFIETSNSIATQIIKYFIIQMED